MKPTAAASLVVALVALVATTASAAQSSKLFLSSQVAQPGEFRSAFDTLPEMGHSIQSYLRYCEAVIHALESELPRKSVFRSLFIDKARLSSGYDKNIQFTYYTILKDRISNHIEEPDCEHDREHEREDQREDQRNKH